MEKLQALINIIFYLLILFAVFGGVSLINFIRGFFG